MNSPIFFSVLLIFAFIGFFRVLLSVCKQFPRIAWEGPFLFFVFIFWGCVSLLGLYKAGELLYWWAL